MLGDQLERVPVAGADEDVEAVLLRLGGQGRDHVIGLVTRLLDVSDVQRIQHLLDQSSWPRNSSGVLERFALYST